jgi:hypothetical protein
MVMFAAPSDKARFLALPVKPLRTVENLSPKARGSADSAIDGTIYRFKQQ